MSTTRTPNRTPTGKRQTFRIPEVPLLRVLPPLTKAAARRASDLGTTTVVSARFAVTAALCSSFGTGAFVLAGFLLLHAR